MTQQKKTLVAKKRGSWRRPPNKKIVYVDGYVIRQESPDFDIISWRNRHGASKREMERIPPNEIWIDHRFKAETYVLLRIYHTEMMRRFANRTDYKPVREYLNKKFLEDGPVPPFIEREEYNKANDLTICYVRGDIVRRYLDLPFIFGGQDLVPYDYIPKRTVWIDVRQDYREIKSTLLHEIRERKLMERGMSYDEAHERATKIEFLARARKNIIWPIRKEPHLMSKKQPALPVVPTDQEEDASCAPASLKMILDALGFTYRGKPYSEKRLRKLSECGDEGTDHAKLIKAAKTCGASVFSKENGTLAELCYFVLKERLPVFIGWWNGPELKNEEVRHNHDLDEGHFSVVVHVTRTHVWLADPWIIDPNDEDKGAAGIRKVPIRQFMRHSKESRPEFSWCDTDTEHYLPVDRWYMVLNSKGKSFRIPGGSNY